MLAILVSVYEISSVPLCISYFQDKPTTPKPRNNNGSASWGEDGAIHR